MKKTVNRLGIRPAVIGALLLAFSLVLGACGGAEEPTLAPTSTPVPPATAAATEAATEAPAADTAEAAAQVSPLANPDSPLAQPESPLAATGATEQAAAQTAAAPQGPSIEVAVPSDFGVISQLAQETKAPAAKAGMASLSAVLYSPVINRVIPGTQFYLTPAIEENGQTYIPSVFVGPQVDLGDVAGITNEKGQLLLDSVPPGKYYLAVWTVYNWPLAFGSEDDALPLLITLEPGEQRDLGLLYVEWP